MFGLGFGELIVVVTPYLFIGASVIAVLFILNKFVDAYAKRTEAMKQ